MRLIDADKLIRKLKRILTQYWLEHKKCSASQMVNDLQDVINNTPTVNEWHYPSKGELPTESDEYLIWVKCIDISECRGTTCFMKGHSSCTCDIDMFNAEVKGWNMNYSKNVIAWMPLPEPPKEEK